jgi:hypothetical protein
MASKMAKMKASFNDCFVPCSTIYKGKKCELLNVYPASGKHILEKEIGEHIYQDEFIEMMKELGHKPNKNFQYKYRVKEEKYFKWC